MKLKCILKRWWRCCGEAEELRYRLKVLRELLDDWHARDWNQARKQAEKANCVTISEGRIAFESIPLEICIDANHFNVHVENGRVQIKATVLKKR